MNKVNEWMSNEYGNYLENRKWSREKKRKQIEKQIKKHLKNSRGLCNGEE